MNTLKDICKKPTRLPILFTIDNEPVSGLIHPKHTSAITVDANKRILISIIQDVEREIVFEPKLIMNEKYKHTSFFEITITSPSTVPDKIGHIEWNSVRQYEEISKKVTDWLSVYCLEEFAPAIEMVANKFL